MTPSASPTTYFAPARRASREEVTTARQRIMVDRQVSSLLDALPDYVLVLNEERQILATNQRLLEDFGITDLETLIGKRPGEALGCVFAEDGPCGCGTDIHCSVCGAVKSILESQRTNARAVAECHLNLEKGGGKAIDLEVVSSPAVVESIPVTVCILRDISDEKRRTVLERVFFHDVMNTAGGIHGIASLLAEGEGLAPDKDAEYKVWMLHLSGQLIDEINHHRRLVAAERGEFRPMLGVVHIPEIIQEVHALYANHDIACGRRLVLDELPATSLVTDPQILRRILGNLVKNALEATPRDGMVTLRCVDEGDRVTFSINNPGVMTQEVQLQIFQRSFTTKGGAGRGIGTYSVKLFTEKYLMGSVGFTSREPEGTTFYLTLPKQFEDPLRLTV